MTTQWDLSRIYQRKVERMLAGFALIHPLQALTAYQKVEGIMLDAIAFGWLSHLTTKEQILLTMDIEKKVQLCSQIAMDWEEGKYITKLTDGMNRVYLEYEPVSIGQGELVWSHYSAEYIGEDLENRIEEQRTFRSGLQDLTWFASSYLEGNYAR